MSPLRLIQDLAVSAALLAVLMAVYAEDKATPVTQVAPVMPEPGAVEEPEPPPPLPEILPPAESLPPIDPEPRIAVKFFQPGRFGVSATTGNPDDPTDDAKRLTFGLGGETNNTRLWIDGATPLILTDRTGTEDTNRFAVDGRREVLWSYEHIDVRQSLELVAGDISRRMDTIRVLYKLKNCDTVNRVVGLRVMLDTLIGANDGVPFIVPGIDGIITKPTIFEGEKIPDFVRALEQNNLANPGVIADIGLKLSDAERPSRLTLSHWPGTDAPWDFDTKRTLAGDSAAGIYFEPRPLAAGESRTVGFTYGLGTISSTRSRNARLSLTAGGPFRAGGQFWAVALIQHPKPGQSVRLSLPEGLKFAEKQVESQTVPAGADVTQLSWLVQIDPGCIGQVELKATLEPDSSEERQALTIKPRDARLTAIAKGPIRSGQSFWVVALIQNPHGGQNVTLDVPLGLTLGPKETRQKVVPIGNEYSQVSWLIKADPGQTGERKLSIQLQPESIKETTLVTVEIGNLVQ